MRKVSAKIGVTAFFALALFAFSFSQASAQKFKDKAEGPVTLEVDCDAGESIQAALDQAKNGDTINVSGTCNERVTIILDNLTLVGDGTAVIDGDTPAPVGGLDPLLLVLASNVTIRDITVQDGPGQGINIRRAGSAVIQGTIVRRNKRQGIGVSRNSFAVIGASPGNHATPGSEGNIISGNGGHGVNVRLSAGAKIFHNNILDNVKSGISLSEGGSADIDGNSITGNDRGISLSGNASVRLSDSSPHGGELNLINGNDVGVRCRTGGALRGIAPDFTVSPGNTSDTNFTDGTCVESIASFP